MKKQTAVAMIIAGVFMLNVVSAQTPNTALKVGGVHQFASFEGYRTHSWGFGASAEKLIGYSRKSVVFTFNYLTRSDDGPISIYDNVYYFAIGGRQYASYEQPMHGPYLGFLFGVGIPDGGTYWDFDFTLGYQLVKNKIVVDLNTAIGFCSFNYREDTIVGSFYYYFPGFVFRPGLSIGVAL